MPLSSSRPYTFGVIGVALLGIVMLVVYVLWSGRAISTAIEASLDSRARDSAVAYRDKLLRALGAWDPASAASWSMLDPTLEEAFESLPYLRGIVIRLSDNSIGAVIGRPELRNAVFLPAPERIEEMSVVIDAEGRDQPRATVSFVVAPRPNAPRSVQANVHLQFASLSELQATLFRQFQVGTVLVGLVIYLLAALAFYIARTGQRSLNREREKAVRLKAIGEVAGAIAHELRNPLNAISLSFQVIGETLSRAGNVESSRAQDLDRARGEVAKISKVVDNFVSFARLSDMNVTEFDLADVVRESLAGLSPSFSEASVRPGLQATGMTRMRGDRDKIGQAVTTTLQAVFDAVKARPGALDLEIVGKPKEIELRILGVGERVDSRRISNFTASRRAWDEPVGLGLTIARTWIDLHGGKVTGGGPSADRAEISIVLPKGFD